MAKIEVLEFKKMQLDGSTMIDGFPSVGLAGTIAANYLVASLQLDQVAALDSEYFPPLAMIYASKPKFPARIYASEPRKVAVAVSEFTPPAILDRQLARTLFDWSEKQRCSMIITPMGLPTEEKVQRATEILGVGSTDRARQRLDEARIPQLEVGMIVGIAGALMNLGRWENYDVIALLTTAHPKIPDAMAAAKLVEAYNRLLPEVEVDVGPLRAEAEKIETRLKSLRTQVKPVETEVPRPEMYA